MNKKGKESLESTALSIVKAAIILVLGYIILKALLSG